MKINDIEELLDRFDSLKENRKLADANDTQLKLNKLLGEYIDKLVNLERIIFYISENLSFSADFSPQIDEMRDIFKYIAEMTNRPELYSDSINKVITVYRGLESRIKKNWSQSFKDWRNSKTGLLELIRSIDQDTYLEFSKKIRGKESWSNNISDYVELKKADEYLNKAIEQLGLGDNIVINHFLSLVNSGKATLRDVTPEVLVWLQDHDLESRVKLVFK